MSGRARESVPIRGLQPWTSSARLKAREQLHARLEGLTSAIEIATVGAEYLYQLLVARTVTISTLDDGYYEDLVSVGYLPPREDFYPPDRRYAVSLFPIAVNELRDKQGYFTTDLNDPKYAEFVGSRDDVDVSSIMGVAIMTAGTVRGEVFCTRGRDEQPFDRDDLELARDLATPFGSILIKAMDG
jgi:hypothetical protein